jgi:hypothetical protein
MLIYPNEILQILSLSICEDVSRIHTDALQIFVLLTRLSYFYRPEASPEMDVLDGNWGRRSEKESIDASSLGKVQLSKQYRFVLLQPLLWSVELEERSKFEKLLIIF